MGSEDHGRMRRTVPVTRREPNDALRVIADVRGSEEMRRVWECERGSIMTVGTAYSTLGVSRNADESTSSRCPIYE
jgi:hypothetical protein